MFLFSFFSSQPTVTSDVWRRGMEVTETLNTFFISNLDTMEKSPSRPPSPGQENLWFQNSVMFWWRKKNLCLCGSETCPYKRSCRLNTSAVFERYSNKFVTKECFFDSRKISTVSNNSYYIINVEIWALSFGSHCKLFFQVVNHSRWWNILCEICAGN